MAVLDVDEVEAGLRREHGGVDVATDELVELVVAEQRVVGRRRRAVEERVPVRDARRGRALGRANRPEWVSCRPTTWSVGEQRRGGRRCPSTVRSSSTSWFGFARPSATDRRRLAPHEPAPLGADARPPPPDQVGRPAVVGAVPALHREHGEAVRHRSAPAARRGWSSGVAAAPAGIDWSTVRSRGDRRRRARRCGRERLERGERLDLAAVLTSAAEPFGDVGEHGPVALGRRGAPGGCRVAARPATQLEEHRGVVAVGRHRRPEGEGAEVLEHVVELVERGSPSAQYASRRANASGANVARPSR